MDASLRLLVMSYLGVLIDDSMIAFLPCSEEKRQGKKMCKL